MAIQYLTRSLKSDGNDAQSWYLLGRCYMAEQNYNKAYEAYQQAVYRDARNPTFWCSIGVLYYQINQYRDALDAYSRAIRLNPYISEVWYDLGTLYESCNNQVQDALDAYQRAADLDPSNPHIKQRLELLRKSQGSSAGGAPAAPVPQDVNNPNQYQNGQSLNGTAFSQSQGPQGPPAGMAQYPSIANQPRGGDNRGGPPMHEFPPHESAGGPPRDLPMPGGGGGGGGRRSSPGPYGQHTSSSPRDDVRIADIGGGRAPTPSDRTQMNPIHEGPNSSRMAPQHPHSAPSQPSPLPKRQQPPHSSKGGRDDMRSPIPPHQGVSIESSRITPPGALARPPSRGPSPHTSHYSSPRQHHASAAPDHHHMHHEQMMNNSRRSSDPYEHEGIFHRVQPKNSHPSPYAQHSAENNGFHPVEHRGSPATVKQEDEVRGGGGGGGGSGGVHTGFHRSPENHHASAEAVEKKAPADERPSSREVDEDYDETAADTLMSMAQTGGRKRSLDRHDEVANVDSDSKRPKPAAEPEDEQPTAAPHQEEPQQESESQVVSEVEKTSVVAEQQSEAPPATEEAAQQEDDEPKDEPMEDASSSSASESAAVVDQAPVEEPTPKEDQQPAAEPKPSSPPSEQPDAAEEGEADPEKEEGETDAAEPSKDEQDAAEVSEPEAGEVTPSPEATTA
ncbi:unnamed protein product [Umbelopsis ramanniana]